jgi:hypothetical protein
MKLELELTNDQFECLCRAIVDRIVSCTGQANECDQEEEIDCRHWREQALLAKEIRAMLEPISDRLSDNLQEERNNVGDMLFNLLVDINRVYAAGLDRSWVSQ